MAVTEATPNPDDSLLNRVEQARRDIAAGQIGPKPGYGPRERANTVSDNVLAEALQQLNKAKNEKRD